MSEIISKGLEPICGWQWIYAHLHDLDGWRPTIELSNGHSKHTISINPKQRGIITEVSKILNK